MALPYAAASQRDELDVCALGSICGKPMEIQPFLELAIAFSATLSDLHQSNIVHKNICLDNVCFNSNTGEVSIAYHPSPLDLAKKAKTKSSGSACENSFAYMSPEQMGRMNRVIDSRSDLYSTGIIFYQLITGELPFVAVDLLEWVHCHVARIPKKPRDVLSTVPEVVSDIVMKLLEKSLEGRYQSAVGLRLDLERCLADWQRDKHIDSFPLGSGDVSDKLLIPQKLFGREQQLETLHAAFSRVAQKGVPEIVMITGYSGIGKTALVRELYQPIVQQRGLIVWGKSDQYKRNIPYGIFIEAFEELIRQLLTKDDLSLWKKKIEEVLGVDGGLLVEILPQLELILGEQPPVPELPLNEAECRFNMVFGRFMCVFASKSHPLVIFFDDLQWIDPASLKLLKYIAMDLGMDYLLLIGAYRDNEVEAGHALITTLAEISGSRAILRTIPLASLSFTELAGLLNDTFNSRSEKIDQLTRLVYKKTAGNPFFVIQFLMTLHTRGLILFDGREHRWTWDIERIRNSDYTDNVVDLMVAKLEDLPEATRVVLQMASCIGNRFDLKGLAVISNVSADEAIAHVMKGVGEGLLLSAGSYHYRFLHDRVQQAAYSLIPEEDLAIVHLQIGRLLLINTPPAELEEKIFDLTSHLNRGLSLVFEPEEQFRIAKLNLLAGKKAKDAAAYQSAKEYLSAGISLLWEEIWTDQFDLAYGLHKEAALVEYLMSNYARSEELICMLLKKAKTVLEKADLYNILIVQYTLTARYKDAIRAGRTALSLLDISLPEKNLQKEYLLQREQYRSALGKRKIATLADDPEMSDPRMRAGVALLSGMMVPARYTDSTLFALINIVVVNISLRYGPTAKSTVGLSGFGLVLNAEMNNYQDAYELGLLALKISERFEDTAQKCQSCVVLGHYLTHWVRHLRHADVFNDQGYQAGLSSGEMQWAGYNLAYKLFQPFYRGERLDVLRNEIPDFLAFTQRTKNQWASDTLIGVALALTELQDHMTENKGSSVEEIDLLVPIDEFQFLATCRKHKSFGVMGRYMVLKAQIHYLYGRLDHALEAVQMASNFQGYFSSSISVAALNFYHSLILAAVSDTVSETMRVGNLEIIAANQRQMQIWSENCKENFEHQFLLIQAEIARIEGDELLAQRLYEQSIASAELNGFVQDKAVALECASGFYRRRGFAAFAELYLQKARDSFHDWGAEGKVRQLEKDLPPKEPETGRGRGEFQEGMLDAMTVIKASQAISGEIVIERLMETLLKAMIENAGAQKGCLVLAHGDELALAATAMVIDQEIIVEQQDPFPLASVLPETVVLYVRRTHEAVVLDDVLLQNTFSNDPYFLVDRPQSLLCLPLLRQADLMGVLYLENSLVKDAFPASRVAVLELLAAQAVISLENAILYRERSKAEEALQKSEDKYRTIFENSSTGLIFVEEDQIISVCNKEFEKLTGYSKEEVEGKMKWTCLVAEKDVLERMVEYHRIRRVDPNAAPQAYEFKLIDRAGRIKDMLITVAMIPGKRQSLAAISDISELKQAEGELARLATAIEQSPEAIFIADTEFAIRYVNPAFERLSGYGREEILGKHASILDGNGDSISCGQVRRELQNGKIWSGRLSNRKKDDTYFEAEVTASPVKDKYGVIINYVGIHRDITHEVHLERELRQAQKMEAIGTLAGGIAHDFNNILTSILGYSEMAKLQMANDRCLVEHYLDQVLKSGNRAAELVRQILTFSRRNEHEMRVVQIVTIVSEVLNLLRSSLPSTIEICREVQISPEQSTVFADATQIHQVVMNLGTNAAHAMRENGGVLTIGIKTIEVGDFSPIASADLKPGTYVLLTIKDTGHGMDTKVLERIFDPYFTTKGPGEGSGIGLAVVQGIVKGHGGTITVKSKPGKGAVFRVFLPQVDSPLQPEIEKEDFSLSGNEHILFVDDEPGLVKLGTKALEAFGYRVTGKVGSVEAWEVFQATPELFDLVITDMTMPGLTGIDLAARVKGLRADLPVILCTGFSEIVKGKLPEELGANEILAKPYQVSEIARTVRRIFAR